MTIKKSNSKKILNELLTRQTVIMLSTLDEKGFPCTRGMINIHNAHIAPHLKNKIGNSGKEIFFTTNTSSSKMKQIKKNKAACVYLFDGESFKGIALLGKIEEVLSAKTKHAFWHKSWVMYYPEGETGGDYSILKFTPKRYRFYDGENGFAKEEGALNF